MQKFYFIMTFIFSTLFALGIASYLHGKIDGFGLFVLFIPFCIFAILYDKKKKSAKKLTTSSLVETEKTAKEIITSSEVATQKSNNIELITFFRKPTQEVVEKMQEKLADKDDFMKKVEIVDSVDLIIDLAYKDGIITDEEENKIIEYMKAFNLTTKDLPGRVHEKLIKGLVIRDLLAGIYNNRVVLANVPFNFMKSEKIIYAFPNISISEIKTVHEYQAGSRGMSFRVMKGVYYHTGGTKGQRIEKQELKRLGYSDVAITNKHLYFQANNNAMRVKHDKIVSIIPDEDGVTVFRDGARANPLYFRFDDSWFFANILQNAQNID